MRFTVFAIAAAFTAAAPALAAPTVTAGASEGVHTDALEGATITATSPVLGGFSAQDAFGAVTPNNMYPESSVGGHVIFADGNNPNFIDFNTAAPALLSGVNIFVSDDGGNSNRQFATVTLFAGTAANALTNYGTATLAPGAFTVNYAFAAPALFQYFRFEGTNFSNGPRLLEIDGVSPVPEPASWALMLAGFGLAGMAMRARRRTLAAA